MISDNQMYDVVALGELLVDFSRSGKSAQGNDIFEACPGGAPCNMLAMLAKLGRKTAFIGKLGGDMFGHTLKEAIESAGIDSRGVVFDKRVNTTLAFVSTDETGDRRFAFFRNPGADMRLVKAEIDEDLIRAGKIFHFGTLSTTHARVRAATHASVETAKSSGKLISFDPNLRPLLWNSLDEAKKQMKWGCAHCDILKISDDELAFLTGVSTAREGALAIKKKYPGITFIFVTSGKLGSAVLFHDFYVSEPAFVTAKTIDTTGAGDIFCGCCLEAILRQGVEPFTEEKLRRTLRFANAAASIVTTRKGALRAVPDQAEIQKRLSCID